MNLNKTEGVMKGSDRTTGGGYLDITYRIGNLRFINKVSVDLTDSSNPIPTIRNAIRTEALRNGSRLRIRNSARPVLRLMSPILCGMRR